jgi:uncharacterized protein
MKILIDIGHPAHVHYFRNFTHEMTRKGHKFLIIARDKEITHKLLRNYYLPFKSRGKGRKSIIGKLYYLLVGTFHVYREAKKFKPDIFMSFGSMYAAYAAIISRRPHIAFDDTEHAKLEHLCYAPFSKTILTPSCFSKDFGVKQIRFKSYLELSYLHPNWFTPNDNIYKLLELHETDKYVILRFVSWNASHDIGHSGINNELKYQLVAELSKYAKVFISSESDLPSNLYQYKLKIPPEKIHDALAFASLYVGEGATMASECAMLGTPAIYVNSLSAGTLEEQEQYGLIYSFRNSNNVLEKALELIDMLNCKKKFQILRDSMLEDKIDFTRFLVDFIENYSIL